MSTDLQTTPAQPPATQPKTVKGWLSGDYFRKQIALCLPKHLTPERFCRVALSALIRQPKLGDCTPESVMQCMLTLSSLGLEPDGRRAHLIPFKDNKANRTDCTLIIDYKGLAELAQRSGTISNIHADVVCENDVFEYDRGELKAHKIDFRKPRGEPYAAYALVRFKDGGEKCEVMGRDDIYAVRDKSHGWRNFKNGYSKQNPWADAQSEPEMWKKTAFRRASKWLVLSPEIADAVDRAESSDIDMRNVTPEVPGLDFSAPPALPETTEAPAPPPAPEPTPMRQRAKTPAERLDNSARRAPEPTPEPPLAEPALPDDGTRPEPPTLTILERLADFCTAEGIGFPVLRKWAVDQGHIARDVLPDKWESVPESKAAQWLRNPVGLLTQLKLKKKEMEAKSA